MDTFLHAFAQRGIVHGAAIAGGISRKTVFAWRHTDPTFAACFEEAEAEARDVLRGEAFRRAVVGWEEYVVSAGHLVLGPDGQPLTRRRYSDTMLIAMLRARVPEYVPPSRRRDLTGPTGAMPSPTAHVVFIAPEETKKDTSGI
jgi:hypothetical protein